MSNNNAYSGYDLSEYDDYNNFIAPKNRSCFRALINVPSSSTSKIIGIRNHQRVNYNGGISSSCKDDKDGNAASSGTGAGTGRYGILHHHQSAFPYEDSFVSSYTKPTTTYQYSTSSSDYDDTRGSSNSKKKTKEHHHNGLSNIICRSSYHHHHHRRNRIGGNTGKERYASRDSNDAKSIMSRNSQAGLLDYDGISFVSIGGAGATAGAGLPLHLSHPLDKKDSFTWKTSKTFSNSSVSSSRKSNGGGGNGGAFPTAYDSFDFVDIDDIQRRSLGKSLIDCVGLKKITKRENNFYKSNNNYIHHGSSNVVVDDRKHPSMIMEEPLPPAVPDSPRFFKFDNALPTHTIQNKVFPQIIFANDDNNEHDNVEYQYHPKEGDVDNHFDCQNVHPNQNNYMHSDNNGEFHSMEMHTTSSGNIIGSFGGGLRTTRTTSRSPSPVNRRHSTITAASYRQNYDFSNNTIASPRSKSSFSRSRTGNNTNSRNPSPKSNRSYKEEEEFLDHLVNTVTAYNSYQEGRNHGQQQQPSGGRMILNQLMNDLQTSHIPEYVEVEHEEYSDDEVSEIGMASTSGGRKVSDDEKEGVGTPTPSIYPQQEKRLKNPNDYYDPTIKQVKRNSNNIISNNDNLANKFINVDERSLKWRLREADKQKHNNLLHQSNLPSCVSREFMETGDSLMDLYNSASTYDGCSPDGNKSGHADDDVDPSFFHFGDTIGGRVGRSKPSLALCEVFEDFGIDDRLHLNNNDRPVVETFGKNDGGCDPEIENVTPQLLSFPSNYSKHYSQPASDICNQKVDENRRNALMDTYIANHHSHNKPSAVPFMRTTSLRSSKYQEINGTAYFSGTNYSRSMDAPKRLNVDYPYKSNLSGGLKHSPQSIFEFES